MSKQFEEEYKQMMQENIPDLWSRIEGGLKDKSLNTEVDNTIIAAVNLDSKIDSKINTKRDSKISSKRQSIKKNWNKISKYSTVIVAAGLCIAVIIPVFLWGRNMGGNNADTTAALAGGDEESAMMAESLESAAPQEAEDELVAQEYATAESATAESATAESATAESATAEESMGIMEDSSKVASDIGMATEGSYETVVGDSGQEFIIDHITYFQVDVTITSYKKLANAYYEGEVVTSSGDIISSTSVIKLYVGDFEQSLEENQTYSLVIIDNMEPTDSRIHDYTIMDQITQ